MKKIFTHFKKWLRTKKNSDVEVIKIQSLVDNDFNELTPIESQNKIKTSSYFLKYIDIIKNNLLFILKIVDWEIFKDDVFVLDHLKKIQYSIDEISKYLYTSALKKELTKISKQMDESTIKVDKPVIKNTTVNIGDVTDTKKVNN